MCIQGLQLKKCHYLVITYKKLQTPEINKPLCCKQSLTIKIHTLLAHNLTYVGPMFAEKSCVASYHSCYFIEHNRIFDSPLKGNMKSLFIYQFGAPYSYCSQLHKQKCIVTWVAINHFIAAIYNTILSILSRATSKNLAVSDLLAI